MEAMHLGSGFDAGQEARIALLRELDADDEWIFESEGNDGLVWVPARLGTRFHLRPVGAETPDLCVLDVFTAVAKTKDVARARALVNGFNDTARLNRWEVLGDPGPEGWWDNPETPFPEDPESTRQGWIATRPESEGEILISVGVSYVIGDRSVELPIDVMVAGVQEQVAAAHAVIESDALSGWAESADDDGHYPVRPRDDWESVASYADARLLAHEEEDPWILLALFGDAATAVQARQGYDGSGVWVCERHPSFVSCEIPYGAGPFPDHSIGLIGPRNLGTADELDTSLVLARGWGHPVLGRGLLVSMQLPTGHQDEPIWWSTHLLNSQGRVVGPGGSSGFAHGIGAWTVRNDEPVYSLFVPIGWSHEMSRAILRGFLVEVLLNMARLSWAARRVLRPFAEWFMPDPPLRPRPPMGLAAGRHARGLAFGEPGAGANPSATALHPIRQHLVGPDTQWARHGLGEFAYDTGPAEVRVHARRCTHSLPGVVVSVSTVVGEIDETTRAVLANFIRRGVTAGLVTDEGRSLLYSQFHSHEPQLVVRDAIPAAVTQALAVEFLQGHGRIQRRGERPDRDEMLNAGLSLRNSPGATFDAITKALDAVRNLKADPETTLELEGAGSSSQKLRWTYESRLAGSVALTTKLEYRQDSKLGGMAVVSTWAPHIPVEDLDRLNHALQLPSLELTVSGGASLIDGVPIVTTARALWADPSKSEDDQIEWLEELLEQHTWVLRAADLLSVEQTMMILESDEARQFQQALRHSGG